ncbi:MAG: CBS domain-containing protein [Candidatus Eiseniibacteriota bacterium]
MKVRELMTTTVASCPPDANVGAAAIQMWENDCGILPVVERDSGRVVGVITDRDICMALATTGKSPNERPVGEVVTGQHFSVPVDADVKDALEAMEKHRVRRLLVTGPDGRLKGVLSINDLILDANGTGGTENHVPVPNLLQALKSICAHRPIERRKGSPAKRTAMGEMSLNAE